MQVNCVFWFAIVVILQSVVAGLAKKENEKHHQAKSKVHESQETSPQTLLKAAPLGFGIALKAAVPKLGDKSKTDDKGIKTESETTTETKNGFKTVTTVTKQIKVGKNNTPEVVGQSMERVTTNVFDPKKPEKFKAGKVKGKQGLMFDLFNPFGFSMFADEPVKQCSNKKHCKKPGMYCDKMDYQCRKKVKLDGRCDQAGQCDTNSKHHVACLWGRCSIVKKSVGDAGLFCKKDKDCGSKNLHCALQPDISEVSKVCIYKLSEGQTCGRSHIFSFFPLGRMTADLPCKEGFTCQELRFTGRKICRRHDDDDDDDDDDEA